MLGSGALGEEKSKGGWYFMVRKKSYVFAMKGKKNGWVGGVWRLGKPRLSVVTEK